MRKTLLFMILLFIGIQPTVAQNQEYVVSQRFEWGEMIYRQSTGDIYVISSRTGHWWHYDSSQYGQLSTNPRTAPINRYSPTNGFGRIWNAYSHIRYGVGWAALPEIGFDTQIDFANNSIYLHQLNGNIYRLLSDGTWSFVNTVPPVSDETSILSFVVSPLRASPTTSINIQWEISGVEYALLEIYDTSNNFNIEFLDFLPISGNLSWEIPESVQGNLLVRIYGADIQHNNRIIPYFWERLISEDRTVTVTRDTFTFTTSAAYQPFANGFMIWREDTGAVRVFQNTGEWQIFSEARYGSLPINDLSQVADCNIYPVNAFAIVWGTIGNFRQMLGCATTSEIAYVLTIQSSPQSVIYSLPDASQITITDNHWSS